MRARLAVFAAALTTLAAAPTFAQDAAQNQALRQACTGDYLRLCSQYQPGSPGLEQCFESRAKDLSPKCSAAIGAYTKTTEPKRR